VVGFTAGFGKFIGYNLRSATGYLSDKTGRHWLITIVGYVCDQHAGRAGPPRRRRQLARMVKKLGRVENQRYTGLKMFVGAGVGLTDLVG
jgi:hypothetical protein